MKGNLIPEFLKKKIIIAGIDLAKTEDITGGVQRGFIKHN